MTAHRSQGQTLPQETLDYKSCKGTEAPYVMMNGISNVVMGVGNPGVKSS
jgi:hypothetical protein